jgi:hypothetical protein
MAEAVGQKTERGREDELRGEERGGQKGESQLVGVKDAVRVEDEQSAGQPGAEAERERAEEDGVQRTGHGESVAGLPA